MIYKPTKMDMAKVIVTALYNLPELVTKDNRALWREAIVRSRAKKDRLTYHYAISKRILEDRI